MGNCLHQPLEETVTPFEVLNKLQPDSDIQEISGDLITALHQSTSYIPIVFKSRLFAQLRMRHINMVSDLNKKYDHGVVICYGDLLLSEINDLKEARQLTRTILPSRDEVYERKHLDYLFNTLSNIILGSSPGRLVPFPNLDDDFRFVTRRVYGVPQNYLSDLPKSPLYDLLLQDITTDLPLLLLRNNIGFTETNILKACIPNPLIALNTPIMNTIHRSISCILGSKTNLKYPKKDPLTHSAAIPLVLITRNRYIDDYNDTMILQLFFNLQHNIIILCFPFMYYLIYKLFIEHEDFDHTGVNKKLLEEYIIYRFKYDRVPLDLRYSTYSLGAINDVKTAIKYRLHIDPTYFIAPTTDIPSALQYCLYLDPVRENPELLKSYKEIFYWYRDHTREYGTAYGYS